MPELIQCSSAPSSPPPPRRPMPPLPPEPPPKAIASDWEDWEGFRFTFLRYFNPEDVAALRGTAQLLYDMVLETPRLKPDTYPAPETRWELVAVLSELRFLEGFLTSVQAAKVKASLPPKVETLCDFAGGLAYEIGEIGRRLNEELAKWRA